MLASKVGEIRQIWGLGSQPVRAYVVSRQAVAEPMKEHQVSAKELFAPHP